MNLKYIRVKRKWGVFFEIKIEYCRKFVLKSEIIV